MKRPFRNSLYLSLNLALLAGCTGQEGRLQSIRQQLDAAGEANRTAALEIQELNQKLSSLKRQVSGQASQRPELQARVQRSGSAEQVMAGHRRGLEESLNQLSGSVAAYRQQYLTP